MQGLPEEFGTDLAKALEQRFGVQIPVVQTDPGTACVLVAPTWSGGDMYSGHSTTGRVTLLHFLRPDDGTPMSVTLDWTVHELSGQLDHWVVKAKGFGGPGMDALRALLEPRPAPHIGNNATLSVVIDGVTVPR